MSGKKERKDVEKIDPLVKMWTLINDQMISARVEELRQTIATLSKRIEELEAQKGQGPPVLS